MNPSFKHYYRLYLRAFLTTLILCTAIFVVCETYNENDPFEPTPNNIPLN